MHNSKLALRINNSVATTLGEDEVDALKVLLDRVLKIGVEAEWGLKDSPQSGTCRGDSVECPCTNVHKVENNRKCYQVCKKESTCEFFGVPGKCVGIFCINFSSPCTDCKEFQVDCSKCDLLFNPLKTASGMRDAISKELLPTNNVNICGEYGVFQVKTDNSCGSNGGVEVPTVGKRADYYEFIKMLQIVYSAVNKHDAFMNDRTGIHFHILAGYNANRSSELEKPMPDIVLRNIHQLFRIFQNALVWITSAGNSPERRTRWAKFRSGIMKVSGVKNSGRDIINLLRDKYNLVSYRFCEVNSKGDLSKFHIEVRVSDGINSPTAVAALSMLMYAFIIKAIDLSLHGVVMQPASFYKMQAEISELMLNNTASGGQYTAGLRYSDTSALDKHIPYLQSITRQMISFLKPALKKWPEAIDVLHSLAERPCSTRIIEGVEWEDIETNLSAIGKKKRLIEDYDIEIIKAIDLCIVTGKSKITWAAAAAKELGKTSTIVKKGLARLQAASMIEWSSSDRSYIRK
jgi:hypothetical protein